MSHDSVTLEHGRDGGWIGWVHELPGCFVRGNSREDVERDLPAAIEAFTAWAGEPAAPVDIEVGDVVESQTNALDDSEATLAAEQGPLEEEQWQRLAAWLERSRAELEELVRSLEPEELVRRREGTSWLVGKEIVHIGFTELMYALWTFDLDSPAGIAEFLAWSRRASFDRLSALARAGTGTETRSDWSGAPRPERWTPRKAARRLVWHELLHLRQLERARREGRLV
ncbi:MAG TPA: type II toxin-antitoxin system HicB family antitoxin [Gaiellaceae bacterium]|nr:type II toxin-antitoxin system HicB family antitoxin [Gaiellaceae bacterium]